MAIKGEFMSEFDLIKLGENSKAAAKQLAKLNTNEKNQLLRKVAEALVSNKDLIIEAYIKDM